MSDSLPIDYGAVDPLASTIRYTSLDACKQRLGIEVGDTSWDTELTRAIISGEVSIDIHLGRSFPDGPGVPDVSEPGPVQGIPEQIRQAAENIGVAVFRGTDSPFGVVGSDEYLGELDVTEVVRREIGRSPLLRGYRVAWGVA